MQSLMSSVQYYTKEGLDKLKKELKELKTKGRSNMAKQIATARDKGDLSENAEYDAAKDAQGLLEMRISKLETLVFNARVLDKESVDDSCVRILSRVQMKHKGNGSEMSYQLVSEEEADLKAMRISVTSPIGRALLGKKVGESACIEAPAGTFEVEIRKISR